MIKLYIYRNTDGLYLIETIGNPTLIFYDLTDKQDFTLEPPPNHENQWYWYDNQWNLQPR